jgi:type IV pilus assembly protein PilY1
MIRSPVSTFLAGLLSSCLASTPLIAAADDIDIFTGASGGNSVNPRVLIVLDNTSNWSRQAQKWPSGATQGQSETNAIKTMLDDLDGSISLGLMEFVTGGNANDTGGFIRYAIRPMNSTNKANFATQLTTIYNNINSPDEKRNSNTPYGDLMYDTYNYFAGTNAYSPSAVVASKADSAGYTTNYTKFASPLSASNTCGDSFVIVIGNADSSGPTSDSSANTANLNRLWNNRDAAGNLVSMPQLGLPNFTTTSTSTDTAVGTTAACYKSASAAAAELPSFPACSSYTDGCKIGTTVSGGSCSGNNSRYSVLGTNTVITTTPTGTTSTDTGPHNADEWAKVLHDRGVPVPGSTTQPSVTTYTIDVYNAQPNATQTALLMSMAKAGGGKYFAAKNEAAIVDALRQIMIEIQAVNVSFASTSLPVNATNRSQNENQVFIGMFRPDPVARPRWFGNLKRYQLITSGSDIDLGDVNGKPAINTLTGFVTPCATSYWTSDSGSYWSGLGVSPDPAGTCAGSYNKYSDAPDGPFVEKGSAAEILRMGNVAAGTAVSQAVNRNVYTLAGTSLSPLTTANSGLDANLVKFIRGEDVNNEKGTNQLTTTRPSIHGDVIHSRPLPVNYGGTTGVTVYYGANDGTLRALNANTGVERWAFVAPEFFARLARLKDNSPLVAYPNLPEGITPAPTRKDYFFDGSTGIYQNADSSQVWIYPTMRRGGRMIYGLDVSNPDNPVFKWKAGCPNLADNTGCTTGMESIGQTWSTPNVAFIKGYGANKPVLVVGGGYDKCEDTDSKTPSCSSTTGGAIFVLDGNDGTLLRSFPTERAVAADVALVDVDNDGMPDYAYAADTGGNLYRVDFVSGTATPRAALTPASWNKRMVARTSGGGRKFLFAPALLPAQGYVYVAIGSGDREHPLYEQYPYANVLNRFYVYKDDLGAALSSPVKDLDALEDYSTKDSCTTTPVLPSSSLSGWFMNLNASGQGEQVVTSALIAGGMVTFSTNRPIPPQAGTCSTTLGEARGYWVNLLNASGAIGTQGACGGTRSSPFVGGGLPPSPVLANGVPVDGKATTVVIGAVQKGSNGAGGASVAISPQKIRPPVRSKRTRTYSYTSGD